MEKSDKYRVAGEEDGEFEPGSGKQVLKNLLGIKEVRIMDAIEAREYDRMNRDVPSRFTVNHQFTAQDVCDMHKDWLGSVYSWAGQYRMVDLSKPDILFAHAQYIPKLMEEFEHKSLKKMTPCCFTHQEDLAKNLAIVHVELILIHPFREGNGRLSRLLAILMAEQAGLPRLDFWGVEGNAREEYFVAVREGWKSKNYRPMENIFRNVIERTIKQG